MPKIDTEKLEAYAQMIFERENQFNKFTLETIARRIKATGQLSAHDQQALKNIADISGDMDKITKELARITKMNIEDIEKIYAQVVNEGVNTYKPLYDFKGMEFKPITENDHAMKLVRHWAEETSGEMINLSRTKALGFVNDNGDFTQLAGAFQQTIDDAVIAVSNGTIDFNSAMKGTIEQLGGSGVHVNYGSGVSRSLEAMIRQNLLYGAKQAAQSYDEYVGEELGLDGFEVDAHSGCRPSHEFMQGKMYSYNGDKVIDGVKYEDGSEALEALKDYGCLHFKTDVLLGVSQPTYNKKELDRIHKETTEKIEYNGKKKTLYEWKQTQRRLEREYRKAQTQSDMFKASGNNVAATDFKQKADAIRSTYDDLTNKVPGLYDHSERMRTYFKNTSKKQEVVKPATIDNADKAPKEYSKTKEINSVDASAKNKNFKTLNLEEYKNIKHTITKEERSIIYGKGHFSGYINSSDAKHINKILREGGTLSDKQKEVVGTLQKVIDKNTIPDDIIVTRYVASDALESIVGVKIPTASLKMTNEEFFELLDKIPSQIPQNHTYTEKAFLSTSGVMDKNVMKDKNIMLKIKVPKGTHGYVSSNYKESEIIFGQGTKLKIENVSIQDSGTHKWKVVIECVMQE